MRSLYLPTILTALILSVPTAFAASTASGPIGPTRSTLSHTETVFIPEGGLLMATAHVAAGAARSWSGLLNINGRRCAAQSTVAGITNVSLTCIVPVAPGENTITVQAVGVHTIYDFSGHYVSFPE